MWRVIVEWILRLLGRQLRAAIGWLAWDAPELKQTAARAENTKELDMITLTDEQQVRVSVEYKTAAGNPARVVKKLR